jgi:hypothetical protein
LLDQAVRAAHPRQPDGRLDHVVHGVQPRPGDSAPRCAGGSAAVRVPRVGLRPPGDPRPRVRRRRSGGTGHALGRRTHRGDRSGPGRGRAVRPDGQRLPAEHPQGRTSPAWSSRRRTRTTRSRGQFYDQLRDVFAKQGLVPTYRSSGSGRCCATSGPAGDLLLLRARDPDGRCIATAVLPWHHRTMYFWGGPATGSTSTCGPTRR